MSYSQGEEDIMETFEVIASRASVREYQDKPIEKDSLEKLVDAGRRAPTARCVEPWEFIVITNKDFLVKFAGLASNARFMAEASACIAVFAKETKYYLEDGSAAIENILLAAAELGLGACWIAGDKKPYVSEVADMLAVPTEFKLVGLVSLGWPKNSVKQNKRRPLTEVIHWEKFGKKYNSEK